MIEAFVLTHKHSRKIIKKISQVPTTPPAFKRLGSTPGGLTEPPEDKLEGELPG